MKKALLVILVLFAMTGLAQNQKRMRLEMMFWDVDAMEVMVVLSSGFRNEKEYFPLREHPEIVFDLDKGTVSSQGRVRNLPPQAHTEMLEAIALIQSWSIAAQVQLGKPDAKANTLP